MRSLTLTCLLVIGALVALVAPPKAGAQTNPPQMCTSEGPGTLGQGRCTFTATKVETFACEEAPSGSCSEIRYEADCNFHPDKVFVSVDREQEVVFPSAFFVSEPCQGVLTHKNCSAVTVKLLDSDGVRPLRVAGAPAPVTQGICALKYGFHPRRECCAIAGFGIPRQNSLATNFAGETSFSFKGCSYQVPVVDGVGSLAQLNPGSDPACRIGVNAGDESMFGASIGGMSLGDTTFLQEGSQGTAGGSCGYQFFRGRLYVVCNCQPDPNTGVLTPFEQDVCGTPIP